MLSTVASILFDTSYLIVFILDGQASSTFPLPKGLKVRLFSERQKSVMNDVKRAFRALQSWFTIICGLAWCIDGAKFDSVMLHNIIVEDERESYDLGYDYDYVEDSNPEPNIRSNHDPCHTSYLCKVV